MGIDIHIYLKGGEGDPDNLNNGPVLLVSSGLSGVIPILEQIGSPEEQFLSLKNILIAQYGAANVTDASKLVAGGTGTGVIRYKYEYVEGEGLKRICYYEGSLEIKFSQVSEYVRVDFSNGTPYPSALDTTLIPTSPLESADA